MSDRFLLKANCSCGYDLNEPDETGQELFLAIGDSIDLKCPKCHIVWRFCNGIKTNQKIIDKDTII